MTPRVKSKQNYEGQHTRHKQTSSKALRSLFPNDHNARQQCQNKIKKVLQTNRNRKQWTAVQLPFKKEFIVLFCFVLFHHSVFDYTVDPRYLEFRRPRWLSWMRRPTEDQEVAGSTPAEVGNILSWRLIMKYFLRSFSPFRCFKKGSCQFLTKECAQYWLTA